MSSISQIKDFVQKYVENLSNPLIPRERVLQLIHNQIRLLIMYPENPGDIDDFISYASKLGPDEKMAEFIKDINANKQL